MRQRRFEIAANAQATKTLRVIRYIANIYDGGCIPVDAGGSFNRQWVTRARPATGWIPHPPIVFAVGTKAIMKGTTLVVHVPLLLLVGGLAELVSSRCADCALFIRGKRTSTYLLDAASRQPCLSHSEIIHVVDSAHRTD
jgi:hypothetical protein